MRYQVSACLFVSLLVTSACAQRGSRGGMDTSSTGNVTIRVVYPDERPAPAQLLVQLMGGGSAAAMATAFTNAAGETTFSGVPLGMYHVAISGESIENSDSGSFEVDSRKSAQTQFVYVKPKTLATQSPGGPATIPASSLRVPKKAEREFNKGGDAITAHDWKKALEHLNKAIELYPEYVAAYSNLGVVYGQLDDPVHQREALEKAVSLDDHFAPALVNLARLDYRDKRFSEAQDLLEKATRVDPSNAQTLTLLAQADLVNQHYDDAIANAKKVHNLPHEHFAIIHYIAARALEFKHRGQDALAELQTMLKEEPDGPRAAEARNEAAAIHMGAR